MQKRMLNRLNNRGRLKKVREPQKTKGYLKYMKYIPEGNINKQKWHLRMIQPYKLAGKQNFI